MLITEAEVEVHMQTVQYIISDELAREVLFHIINSHIKSQFLYKLFSNYGFLFFLWSKQQMPGGNNKKMQRVKDSFTVSTFVCDFKRCVYLFKQFLKHLHLHNVFDKHHFQTSGNLDIYFAVFIQSMTITLSKLGITAYVNIEDEIRGAADI